MQIYNSYIDKIPLLNKLEEKTTINKHIWTISMISLLLYILMGMGIVANFIGFIYPAYQSFKCLKSRDRTDDEQWLIYWIVYSSFTVLEVLVSYIMGWIPFYYQIKLCFLVWLSHESTRGAQLLYNKYLEPLLLTHEKTIDTSINKIKNTTIDLVESNTNKQLLNDIGEHIVDKANQSLLNDISEQIMDNIKKTE